VNGLADVTATGPAGELRDLYSTMARIRAFEERVAKHFRDGDIHGFVHVSIGQEAVAAGACGALERDDLITTTHRGHGHCIAKGADPERMFAELFGRATGLCGGKGGSMHIADPALGILGANGIVGAGIPLAAGAGLAARVRRDGRVALAFFGEGAVHCGAFHEGVTLAVAWGLPVVFVCENNGYAEFTPSDAWGGPPLIARAESYGLPATAVAGDDPIAVRNAVAEAAAHARGGEGPCFVEARAVRFAGHYEGDPQQYRDEEEFAAREQHDPLLLSRDGLGAELADELRRAAEEEMDGAVAAALDAPYPESSTVTEDVYA
jgi:TPP-dependent pyruvate/acetoin dehydrogenase alpha subunit